MRSVQQGKKEAKSGRNPAETQQKGGSFVGFWAMN
jgi:hypothetical protein